MQLANTDACASLAVKDIGAAKKFYEGILELEPVEADEDNIVVYKAGRSTINVYKSEYAGTNKATALSWAVGENLEGIARDLKARGVAFEHYDMPGLTREGDIHKCGDMKAAWFKDPDGNILNIVSG